MCLPTLGRERLEPCEYGVLQRILSLFETKKHVSIYIPTDNWDCSYGANPCVWDVLTMTIASALIGREFNKQEQRVLIDSVVPYLVLRESLLNKDL